MLEVISGGGDLVKELDRRLKVSDLVIRHLVVRVDEDLADCGARQGAAPGDVGPPPRGARPAAGTHP